MKKETIIQVVIIAVLAIILGVFVSITVNQINGGAVRKMGEGMPNEELKENETASAEVDPGEEITEADIDLSQYSSNITIKNPGEYTMQGDFENAVLVNSEGDVTLTLNGVNIKNAANAAIANMGSGKLTVKLAAGTENTVSDGGESEYDGCVYSNGPLVIEGDGTLNVYGNQVDGEGIATKNADITIIGGKINIECQDDGINIGGDGGTITINDGEIFIKASGDGIDSNQNLVINGGSLYTIGSAVGGDSGIDTETGFAINGGSVIALGSDMLESPVEESNQKSVCFSLSKKIDSGSQISLKNEAGEEIVAFEAKEDFKTLIVSNEKVASGKYWIYQNGEKTEFSAEVK